MNMLDLLNTNAGSSDGLFGDSPFSKMLADPMTQFAIRLLAAPQYGPPGFQGIRQRQSFGQQVGQAMEGMQGWQREQAERNLYQQRANAFAAEARRMQSDQDELARRRDFLAQAGRAAPSGFFGSGEPPATPGFTPYASADFGLNAGAPPSLGLRVPPAMARMAEPATAPTGGMPQRNERANWIMKAIGAGLSPQEARSLADEQFPLPPVEPVDDWAPAGSGVVVNRRTGETKQVAPAAAAAPQYERAGRRRQRTGLAGQIEQLTELRDRFAPDDPRRNLYDSALAKLTTASGRSASGIDSLVDDALTGQTASGSMPTADQPAAGPSPSDWIAAAAAANPGASRADIVAEGRRLGRIPPDYSEQAAAPARARHDPLAGLSDSKARVVRARLVSERASYAGQPAAAARIREIDILIKRLDSRDY